MATSLTSGLPPNITGNEIAKNTSKGGLGQYPKVNPKLDIVTEAAVSLYICDAALNGAMRL